jgi:hypothetical protein
MLTVRSANPRSDVSECHSCGSEAVELHRFCPWCGAPLRRKLTELFPGHPGISAGQGRMLRVSHYTGLPPDLPHTRVSVWSEEGHAEAVIAIDQQQAARLAGFLAGAARPVSRPGVLQRLRRAVGTG